MNFTLVPFRDNQLIDRLEGDIILTADKVFCRYRLLGDLSRVVWPAMTGDPQREYELWTHTCFEFFLGPFDETPYLEFNLSPGGNWNSFLFSDVRTDMAETDILRLSSMKADHTGDRERQFAAFVDFDATPAFRGRLRVGVSAVIEDIDGNFHYYALAHPAKRPDFHDRDTHTLNCEI